VIEIRSAVAADLTTAVAWLDAAGLPTADLSTTHLESFLFAYRDADPVGMIGLEHYGDCGLLRSLYVEESCRKLGLGAQLVAALEANALASGMQSMWLLTIDADPFFARLGYTVAARDQAPAAVQQSAEFSSLCPGDAVLMQKPLSV